MTYRELLREVQFTGLLSEGKVNIRGNEGREVPREVFELPEGSPSLGFNSWAR